MSELRKIVLGEATTDGVTTTVPILVDGTVIGSIVEVNENHMCNWHAEASTRFVVPAMVAWSRDSLLDTLDALIDRQVQRLATGQPLRASDENPLDLDLHLWIDGRGLRHPLVYAVPYSAPMAPYYNTRYRLMRKQTEDALATGKWISYISMHERPYRLDALMEIVDRLSDQEYWQFVGQFWVDSENIHQNATKWRTLWSSQRPGRETVMEDEEREALAALPEVVSIYRGYQYVKSARGMAWTLDRDKAIWFARRYASSMTPPPRLASATVVRHKILAHFTGRNEHEIVVLSRDLRNIGREFVERKAEPARLR